jgi:rubrerythrin
MKYLSSQPFSSPAATKAFRDNYPMPEPRKSTEVSWLACAACGSPVRPYEATCPACGHPGARFQRDTK